MWIQNLVFREKIGSGDTRERVGTAESCWIMLRRVNVNTCSLTKKKYAAGMIGIVGKKYGQ